MSKDFKEKFERVCALKDRMISLIETQVNGNIESVDAKELGEVADISKDMAEIMKLCCEAEYYHKITEAMDKNSNEDNMFYMNKYAPETRTYRDGNTSRYYDINYSRNMPGRRMYHDDLKPWTDEMMDRMYYNNPQSRDPKEGKAWMSRRMYLDSRDKGVEKTERQKELEHYMNDITDDIMEMVSNMENSDKAMLKQKLTAIAGKL